MEAAAPELPGQRRAGPASAAEQFIDPLGAFADHPAVHNHFNIDIINPVRQAAGVDFMVTHGKVLHAHQASVAGQMDFPGGG